MPPRLQALEADLRAHNAGYRYVHALDLPTQVIRSGLPISRLKREDLPAVAAMGRGIIRLPDDKLEAYFFANPYFPAEAFFANWVPCGPR